MIRRIGNRKFPLKGFLIIWIAALSAAYAACQSSEKKAVTNSPEQSSFVSLDRTADPFRLVVEIGADGKLSLNKIETGTIYDAAPVCEKLKAVFDDRQRTGVAGREVYISSQTEIERKDLEYLIEKLAEIDASPILLVGGD